MAKVTVKDLAGLNLSRTKEVEADADPLKGKPEAAKFKIGALDSFVTAYIEDNQNTYLRDGITVTGSRISFNETAIQRVRFGLKGWKNFKDELRSDIEFKTVTKSVFGFSYEVVSDDCLRVIPPHVLRDLADKIVAINTVTADEAKNSEVG